MNAEKNYHNFEICSATLETTRNILYSLHTSKAPGLDRISSNLLKDGASVQGLHLNFANLLIKISLFLDQCKIA